MLAEIISALIMAVVIWACVAFFLTIFGIIIGLKGMAILFLGCFVAALVLVAFFK